MTKKIRNWLFIVFIGLFVIGTIVISLYASGYKLNPGWPPQFNRLLVKTGMIIIESRPSGALVSLDGQAQTFFSLNPWHDKRVTTAAKLRNILPGEYTVQLEKPGYWTWEKRVKVYPNQASALLNVYLFKSDPPELLLESPVSPLSLSPSGRYLYIPATQTILSTKNQQTAKLPDQPKEIGLWHGNNNELLHGSRLFSANGSELKDFRPLLGDGTKNYFDQSTGRLYYQKDQTIGFLDPASQSATLLLSQDGILSYQPKKDKLWLVSTDNRRTVLQSFALPAGPSKLELELPTIGTYRFLDNNSAWLSLYDSQNQTLYLMNPESTSIKPVIVKNVLSWQWVDDNTLIYNNNWEIFRLSLDSSSSSLLTRVGEEIQEIIWHPKNDYLIFSTADSLQVFNPQLETTTRIFQAKKIAAPVLDAANHALYFWADTGEKSAIFRYLLQ